MSINREPLSYWQNREYSLGIGISQSPYSDLIGQRVLDSHAEFKRQLNRDLYGDPIPFSPPTRWKRFMNWLGDNRVTNAWLVLIGREDIDRGNY